MITNKYFYQHQSIIQIGAFLLISVILFPSPICFPDNSCTYHIKDHLMTLHIRLTHGECSLLGCIFMHIFLIFCIFTLVIA